MKRYGIVILLLLTLLLSGCVTEKKMTPTNPETPPDTNLTATPTQILEEENEMNLVSIDLPGVGKINQVEMSFDGKWLAVTSDFKRVTFFKKGEDYHFEPDFEITFNDVMYLSWSPVDLRICLSASEGNLEIWDIGKKTQLAETWVDSLYTPEIVWSADGQRLVTSMPADSLEGHTHLAWILSSGTLEVLRRYESTDYRPYGTDLIDWNRTSDQDIIMMRQAIRLIFLKSGSEQVLGGTEIMAMRYNGIHWMEGEKFLLVLNEVGLPNPNSRVRILITQGTTFISEYIVASGEEASHAIVDDSEYLANEHKLVTFDENELRIYLIEDDEVREIDRKEFQVSGMFTRLFTDPSTGELYLYDEQNVYLLEG